MSINMTKTAPDAGPDTGPGRAVGAQLVLWRDRTVDAPVEALYWVATVALPAIPEGIEEGIKDIAAFVRGQDQLNVIDDHQRVATLQGKAPPIAAFMHVQTKTRPKRLRLVVAAGLTAVLAVFTACIASWHWSSWQTVIGPVLGVGLLAAARYYRVRWLTWLAPFTVPVALLLGIERMRWWPAVVAGGLLLVAALIRGLRTAPSPAAADAPAAREGVSFPKLWASIEDHCLVRNVTVSHVHTRPIAIGGREVGVAFGMTTRDEITEKLVADIARHLKIGRSRLRWTLSTHEAVGELIVYFVDTLATDTPPPVRHFGELTYGSEIDMGRNDDGSELRLSIAYTHGLVFGDTGSGKSSVMRLIIDAVEDMPDAELYGIDLAGPSLLGAQQRRLGSKRIAFSYDDADAMLDHLIVEAKRRNNALIGGEDYDEDGEVDERFLTDDRDGRRGIVLVLGEYTTFCSYPELVAKLIVLGDVARKTAIGIWAESPDLDKQRLGKGRAIIDIAMVIIAMACPFTDVIQAFGPGKVDSGWRPDLLQPESEGKRNDAGRGYVHGGGRNLPRITKFHTMDKTLAADRRRYRRPLRDRWYAGAVPGVDEDNIIDAEIVDDEENEARAAALRAAIAACGDREGLPVREAPDALDQDTLAAVREAVAARTVWFAADGRGQRAFQKSSLVTALRE